MLKIDGKCAIVLPDGQELFSKTNKTIVKVREYLMRTCNLKEIIYLPSGLFTNTSIKTCIFYFIKKKEGSKILEEKKNKLSTNKVKFYNYKEEKELIKEVSIEEIKNNKYSLNYKEYINKENKEDNTEYKTLDEVCNIEYGTRIIKKKNIIGEYDLLALKEIKKVNIFSRLAKSLNYLIWGDV